MLRIGLVADVQHADRDDVQSGTRTQFYRSAPEKLARAVDSFNKENVDCVLTLGDAIDGNDDDESTLADLERVVAEFDRIQPPAYHVLGNHCLSLDRKAFLSAVGMEASYYCKRLSDDWILVVCDTNDLSVTWPYGHPKRLEGEAYLETRQGPQMTRWNGGIGDDQLRWLDDTLEKAEADRDNVIVAAHHPLFNEAARPTHCAWNWEPVSKLIAKRDAVKLVLAGHDHVGGYAQHADRAVHFVTLEAILEAETDSFATVHVHQDRFEIVGTGSATSRVLYFS